MAFAPVAMQLIAHNNEDFSWSLDVFLPGVVFPLDDVNWHMQVRRDPSDSVVVLEFLTADGSLVVSAQDANANPPVATLTAYRPANLLAGLVGIYALDLKMIRAGMRELIAAGTVTFAQGVTFES